MGSVVRLFLSGATDIFADDRALKTKKPLGTISQGLSVFLVGALVVA
jgi:hypothetical protein